MIVAEVIFLNPSCIVARRFDEVSECVHDTGTEHCAAYPVPNRFSSTYCCHDIECRFPSAYER